MITVSSAAGGAGTGVTGAGAGNTLSSPKTHIQNIQCIFYKRREARIFHHKKERCHNET
jgi:hypothetical protein